MINISKACTYEVKTCDQCKHFNIDYKNGLLWCFEVMNILYKSEEQDMDKRIFELRYESIGFKIPQWCRLQDYVPKKYVNDFDEYLKENNPKLFNKLEEYHQRHID